ncbi:hypothetical protein OG883_30550 [Streptomyces sp. NBC_01142]|uniref:hypothetical protein n=1 Tax=Streptomyces sp. NBC_01142 TaxID=2975865 RepID=UPI00224CBE11|nr:hypothetical protein [Streptomyces sp. NBC_01142]MCX4824131.1 hypothetical protein [Streptomyces sp. NBC_01142]
MRQLPARLPVPGRLAVWIAASLAVAASAGCMSVSDDEGKKPAPSSSTDRRGAVAEPDGGQAVSGGRQVRDAKGGSDKKSKKKAKDRPDASPSASGSGPAAAKPTRGGQRPQPPKEPAPTRGGTSPSVQPSVPQEPTEPTEPPPVSPTPQPSEPTDPPTASSAPEVHAGAMRLADGQGMLAEPTASPQVGPV